MALLQEITEACRGCVRAFVEDRTDAQGRVSLDSLNNFARSLGFGQQPWMKALKVRMTRALLSFARGVHDHNAGSRRFGSPRPATLASSKFIVEHEFAASMLIGEAQMWPRLYKFAVQRQNHH